jgi:hypothetical protein
VTSSFRDGAEPPRDGDNYSMTQSVVPAVDDRWIYHFTHVDNLEAIRTAGILRCDAVAREGMTRTEVGAPDIKESRRRRTIPIEPGGRVGDYVPFYFAPRSPMMYRIACDRRDSIPNRYAGGDKPLVYLVTSVGAVVAAGSTWVATDGNAATATTEFTSDLTDMARMVDWPLMTAERWNNTPDDPDRQRRRQAELLIYGELPLSVIRWVAVHSDERASQVGKLMQDHALEQRIIVRPAWYYGYERR